MGASKRIALLGMMVTMMTCLAHPGYAAVDKKTCKVSTNDIGTIIGRGSSRDAAFEDAATQCFDRREKLYQMKKGGSVDEDSALVMIDMCANIQCGT
jgi:hypothetical protein